MKDLITVKTFSYRHEAGLAKNILAEAGIEALISADDCGGFRPELAFGMGGVYLRVYKKDAAKAREILGVMEEPSGE